MKNITYTALLTVLILLGLLFVVSTVTAEWIDTPEGVIITHYPDKFDRVGAVYHVDEKGIVIDDIFMPFADNVRYMTPQNEHASIGYFRRGQMVGCLLNKQNQIIKLCLLYGSSKEHTMH